MRRRKSFGLWLGLMLLSKHFCELGLDGQQEVINELAAERKYKADSIRAAEKRRAKYKARQQEEQTFRDSVKHETDELLQYLSDQRRAAG